MSESTDIVERLRKFEHDPLFYAPVGLCKEAADEIEQLRKDVQNLNRDCMILAGKQLAGAKN